MKIKGKYVWDLYEKKEIYFIHNNELYWVNMRCVPFSLEKINDK